MLVIHCRIVLKLVGGDSLISDLQICALLLYAVVSRKAVVLVVDRQVCATGSVSDTLIYL